MLKSGVSKNIKKERYKVGIDYDACAMKVDGFDDCIVGTVERFGAPDIICYDKNGIIMSLCGDGMSYEEAYEFFDFNIIGAWVGDTTPCFLVPKSEDDDLYVCGDIPMSYDNENKKK